MKKLDRNVYTKSRLIKELAFRSGIKQSASKQLLLALAEIAYREARQGPFIIPGICKLELCDRKARKIRNPRTGEQLVMPPHKALRITASRRAKNAIAPRVAAVPLASYVPPAPVVEPAPVVPTPVPAPVVPMPVPAPVAPAPVPAPAVEPVKPIEVKPPTGEVPPPAAEPESTETTGVSPVAAVADTPTETTGVSPVAAGTDAPTETTGVPPVDAAADTPTGTTGGSPVDAGADAPMETTGVSPVEEEHKDTPTGETPVVPESEPPEAAETPADAPAAEPAAPVDDGNPISFRCPGCQQEIEAPRECIGQEAECPMCGRIVVVPPISEPGTMYGDAVPGAADKPAPEVVTAKEAEDMDPAQLKNRTIRIDASLLGFDDDTPQAAPAAGEQMISFFCKKCHQEIEATADMAGTTAECPNCGEPFVVPMFSDAGTVYDESKEKEEAQKSVEVQKHSTMRIDLPDDF